MIQTLYPEKSGIYSTAIHTFTIYRCGSHLELSDICINIIWNLMFSWNTSKWKLEINKCLLRIICQKYIFSKKSKHGSDFCFIQLFAEGVPIGHKHMTVWTSDWYNHFCFPDLLEKAFSDITIISQLAIKTVTIKWNYSLWYHWLTFKSCRISC